MGDSVLLCDLSLGSHIHLALASDGQRPQNIEEYACGGREDLNGAILEFLEKKHHPKLKGAAISSRGWAEGGVIHLPQGGEIIARDDLRELLEVQRVNLVNNFVARALAIPGLRRNERQKICGNDTSEENVIAVLGPHYGLGLAALVSDGAGGWTALPGEGGHSDLPVKTDRQWAVLKVLQAKHGYISRELGVSFTGLTEVWLALNVLDGAKTTVSEPETVIALAKSGDARAREAVEMVLDWLAGMASDVALIMGARGGIYLTGALLDMVGDLFDAERFHTEYLNKGSLANYVIDIPVYKTIAPQMEILGLATLFE